MAGAIEDVTRMAGIAAERIQPYAVAAADAVKDFFASGSTKTSKHEEVMVAAVEQKVPAPTPMVTYQAHITATAAETVAVAAPAPEQKVTVALVNVKKTGKKIEATAQHSKP